MKKLFITLLAAIALTALSLASVFAQDTSGGTTDSEATEEPIISPTETSISTSVSSTAVTDPILIFTPISGTSEDLTLSIQANWCYAGSPWGDGRCNTDDEATTNYMWIAGWCHAQAENGNLNVSAEDCVIGINPTLFALSNVSGTDDEDDASG